MLVCCSPLLLPPSPSPCAVFICRNEPHMVVDFIKILAMNCTVLHVSYYWCLIMLALYFVFPSLLLFVLIKLINYITRQVASLMSSCFSGSLPSSFVVLCWLSGDFCGLLWTFGVFGVITRTGWWVHKKYRSDFRTCGRTFALAVLIYRSQTIGPRDTAISAENIGDTRFKYSTSDVSIIRQIRRIL